MNVQPSGLTPARGSSLATAMCSRGGLLLALASLLLLALGCGRNPEPEPTGTPGSSIAVTETAEPAPSFALVATFTPLPRDVPIAPEQTPPVRESVPTETPLPQNFEETIVELRYAVPGLGLDRRLEGNMANRITLSDLASGRENVYRNQGGVLLELRQVLPTLELQDVPAECARCVFLEYELALEETGDSGWLQDEVVLASLDNYFSVGLGAHFPPGTLLGFRRSASPYAPGHTVALTANGQFWAWLATDGQIREPTTPVTATAPLRLELEQLPFDQIAGEYAVGCGGSPVESLYLRRDGQEKMVSIVCPEYSLPSTLLSLYLRLDQLTRPLVADVSLPRPPSAFPLSALLDYRRADGNRLTLFQDGSVVAIGLAQETVTSTLTAGQVVSLTQTLLDSGQLQPGLSTFGPTATPVTTNTLATPPSQLASRLVLRGAEGLIEGEWAEGNDVSGLELLDAILNEMLGIFPAEPSPQPGTPPPAQQTGTPEAATAVTPQISTTPTRAPAGTAMPSPTPTP